MLLKTHLILCMALYSHASKLSYPTSGDTKEISPTISVQKATGGTVYNFVKKASPLPSYAGKPELASGGRRFDDTDEVAFSEDSEDDAVTVPTTPELPSTPPETDVEAEDVTVPTTENPLTPSDGINENDQDAEDAATLPEAPGDVTSPSVPEPPPAEAVPGQPGNSPDSSSSSSSSSEYSSSSSSEEYRYKEAFKKAWDQKIKNELNLNRPSKSKDVLARLYSPLSKTTKERFSKRL